MKITILLSYPASYLFGEIREAIVAADLVRRGHTVQVFRVHGRPDIKYESFRGVVPVTYFPANDRHISPHKMLSDALRDKLQNEPPDILVFKGIGFDIVHNLLTCIQPSQTRVGFILGGVAVDPMLPCADFVLVESQDQIEKIQCALGRSIPIKRMAKYLDRDTADRLYTARQAHLASDFDIVNVGSFEPRKNQIALRPFFGRFRTAMVGDGECRATVAEAATGYPNVHLLGAMPNEKALEVLARARLMVHTSLWEGVPRVIFESLACGTPVVAHGFAIQDRLEDAHAVRLVDREELVSAVMEMLADPVLLTSLTKEGRRYAREHHGPERLAQAADDILRLGSPN